MTTLADYFLELGREEGFKIGLEKARKEGIESAYAQGVTEGKIATAVDIIKSVTSLIDLDLDQAFEATTASLSNQEKAAVRKQLGM